MALLVTGAMGHVGFEVVRRLAPDRKVLGHYHRTFRPGDAEALGPNVTWLRCDLTDAEAVDRLCEDHAVEACIHLAAIANEALARPDPVTAFRVNAGAVVNLLDAARRHDRRRFINGSTGSVFKAGDHEQDIMESQPVDADSVYGSTKACGELMTTAFRAQYFVPNITSARLRFDFHASTDRL